MDIETSLPSLTNPAATSDSAPWTPKPGQLSVMRRNNRTLIPFQPDKIKIAITKAYLAVEGGNAAASRRVHETVDALTQGIVQALSRCLTTGGIVRVEEIQDQVELALMRQELYAVARAYILYREQRRLARETKAQKQTSSSLFLLSHNSQKIVLDEEQLKAKIHTVCADLEGVDPEGLFLEAQRNLFDGMQIQDLGKALIMSARTKIESEPNYSFVAARFLFNDLMQEVCHFLTLPYPDTTEEKAVIYQQAFIQFIHKGISLSLLAPTLQQFDLPRLAEALQWERDNQLTYLGLQTLYDRYFLHHQETRLELPQVFFMRVAMGLALEESDKEARAIEFYHLLSSFNYMCSTPTLFNSGTLRPQLSSCMLTTVPDDLEGIYNALRDNALLQKYASGLGNDWTNVRAMGAYIRGTHGKSQGVVPFLKVANDTAVAVNQGGKRKGAVCAYLETWHLDIEEFLELRKNTGDDRRRTHDMNTAHWIPDLFMKRVMENKSWTLFSPNDVPDLHTRYGLDFEKAYVAYEAKADEGAIQNFKKIPAVQLWRKMLGMLYETGHPWITFKDPCNIRSPQQHVGVVHSSNLCTEITLNTSQEEIAVCNLGSINLTQHLTDTGINFSKLEKTVQTAIRMLDNVIDINFYSVPQAKYSNFRHRPIGLGLMGFQDALYHLNIPYASQEAVLFADQVMEAISYYAISASTQLAEEKGRYETFEGSLWSKGILPIDSLSELAKQRGSYFSLDLSYTLDWDSLRKRVKNIGMRNSNVLAIAPTATISNICGISQSIEPTYQNLYVKSNLSGEFTVVNPYLVKDLKKRNLWDQVLVNDLKYFNGSVQSIDRIPEELKKKYATAFEIDPSWLIEAGARRQKWVDQSQSLNLYFDKPSGKHMDAAYKLAWTRGLKTTYYCRTLGASDSEKATLSRSTLNAVQSTPAMCTIDDPSCESCQ